MRFASLGSGSKGNALLVQASGTSILIDCGFSVRETERRLARLSVLPEEIDALLLSHEHHDHSSGVFRFCKRHGIMPYMTKGSCRDVLCDPKDEVQLIDSHTMFRIGDLNIQPFPVPHDANEPVQFVVSDQRNSIGVLTDAGVVTPHIVSLLRSCDAIMLECNHDLKMLGDSNYPAMLKRRIAGNFGHLSNDQAAGLLKKIGTERLQVVVAAHLSEQNNRPELAIAAINTAFDQHRVKLCVASQKDGTDWNQLD